MMRRRLFLRSVGATATFSGVSIFDAPDSNGETQSKEQTEEETLYRVQLHCSDDDDEVVVVSEPTRHDALLVASSWAIGNGRELGDPEVYASIHSTLDESTFNVLRGFGHLYASSREVYRYVDRGESHVFR
jgi:hypothetical protein